MKETELAEKVIEWLDDQHWEIYQEVQLFSGGSVIDIVAVRQRIPWAIECKTALSLTVLGQAWRHNACYRSIAVPACVRLDKGREFARAVAESYGIGIIEYDPRYGSGVQERVRAPLQRYNYRHRDYILDRLCEEQKTFAAAGNPDGLRFTPYKNTIRQTKFYIRQHPGCTIQEICAEVYTHYGGSSKIACLRQALSNWERGWCDIRKDGRINRYYLKETQP